MDEFEKDRQKRLGERGNPVFERTTETTDLEEMRERTEERTGVCYCGRPLLEDSDLRRCVVCESIACQNCQIIVRNRIVCQSCAEQAYGLDKAVFLTLYLVDKDLVATDQLIEVATDEAGIPVEVQIDAAATTLLERDYLADDESLTPEGREALQVGQQLYGTEDDVQQVIQDARLSEVASRGEATDR